MISINCSMPSPNVNLDNLNTSVFPLSSFAGLVGGKGLSEIAISFSVSSDNPSPPTSHSYLIPSTGAGKDYIFVPNSYEPIARIDFSMTDADTGDVLRNTKSSPNVHLDWSLFGGSGSFIVRRGAIGDFNNYSLIFGPSSQKYCDDPVLEDSTSYWYDARNRSLTDTLYFYHSDHLGTPIAMTDTSGTLVWRAEHAPFGGIYALPVSATSNNLRFPGQYYDSETGLAQNWFRDYACKMGRYYQYDPFISKLILESQYGKITWNSKLLKVYIFVENNPLIFIDYDGLITKICHRLKKGWPFPLGKIHHDFLFVNGHTYSFNSKNSGKVVIDDPFDHSHMGNCTELKCIDEAKLMSNINKAIDNPYPYDLLGFNCQDWAKAMISLSRKKNCCENLAGTPKPNPIPPESSHWPRPY